MATKKTRRTIRSSRSTSVCSLNCSERQQTSIRSFFVTRKRSPPPLRRVSNEAPPTPPKAQPAETLSESPPIPASLRKATAADVLSRMKGENDIAAPRKSGLLGAPNVARATREPNKKKQRTEQLYLDLGQRDFAAPTVCRVCGMLAVHGLAEDAQRHAAVCREYTRGVIFPPALQRQARVRRRWRLPARPRGPESLPATIVEIRPSDGSALLKKVAQVREIVDQELGFVDAPDSPAQTAFLCVTNKRVVGMVLAETIETAFLLLLSSHAAINGVASPKDDPFGRRRHRVDPLDSGTAAVGLERSKQSRKAVLGIYQMWVHSHYRCRGIASALVGAARAHMVFGYTVPTFQLAFSSPTESGVRFAMQYCRRQQTTATTTTVPLGDHAHDSVEVLVYDCSHSCQ